MKNKMIDYHIGIGVIAGLIAGLILIISNFIKEVILESY